MLSVRENLGSKEAAIKYNKDIYESRAKVGLYCGCIGELACEECFHVISDSICLCVGFPSECPNCGFKKPLEKPQAVRVSSDLSSIINFYNDIEYFI